MELESYQANINLIQQLMDRIDELDRSLQEQEDIHQIKNLQKTLPSEKTINKVTK